MLTAKSRLSPGGLALLAAGFDALFPLAVAIGLTVDSPLIFSSGMVIGFGLTSIAYLASVRPQLLKTVWQMPLVLSRQLRRPLFGLMLGGRLNRPLFVAAAALSGVTLPTLVSGLVPIAYMLVLQRSLGSGRYQPIGWRALPPLALAFAGVSLVVASQPTSETAAGWWLLAIGLVISLAAVIAAALTSLDLAWGVRYARKVKPAATDKDEIGASLLGSVSAATMIVPCLLIAGLLFQPEAPVSEALVTGVIIGVMVRAPFTILMRIANFETSNLTINAIIFLGPLLSLGLLIVFGYATDISPWFATAGGLAIVAANLLLATQRSGYQHR